MNEKIQEWYGKNGKRLTELIDKIWSKPEASLEEYEACRNVADFLKGEGFSVKTFNCCGEGERPNTVVADWGSGSPVIGILGEYDALLGLGQDAVPIRSERPGYGHGCGHSLMSPAGAGAVCAARAVMEAEHLPGTLRFIACPAEEIGKGKIYLMEKGVFDGLDCCMAWHPAGYDATPFEGVLQALAGMRFEFFGEAAHAALSPELGKSALDAAELMNIGVQFLREHVTPDVRIHYIYLNGGDRPNIVPSYASLQYYIRAKDMKGNEAVIERVKRIAQGAALMTDTQVKWETEIKSPETCILHSFNRFLYQAMEKIPPVRYTGEEKAFAGELYRNIMGREPEGEILPEGIREPGGTEIPAMGSSDVGCVTKAVPTGRIFGLGILKDIPTHHWGVTATAGMSIGYKASLFAGQALAQAAYEIAVTPSLIDGFKEELRGKQ